MTNRDIQRDRKTERQIDRQTEGQTDILADSIQTDRRRVGQTTDIKIE